MLGLGGYESSSGDEFDNKPAPAPKRQEKALPIKSLQPTRNQATQLTSDQQAISEKGPSPQPSGPILGPLHEENRPSFSIDGQSSNSRALIHDLTLPPIPNLDIPPSPPGSPNPSINAKFSHFLSLKKQDVHFNEKLASSASLKNPSLLKKMMEHAGIDEQMQYCTSLPYDIWDISSLPSWGFKEELLKTQKEINMRTEERRAAGQRDNIEFVAASNFKTRLK